MVVDEDRLLEHHFSQTSKGLDADALHFLVVMHAKKFLENVQ